MPASALPAGVVEQSLCDVLPKGVPAIEPDRIGLLDFHSPLAAAAANAQYMMLDL
jgi:hypothetical protein